MKNKSKIKVELDEPDYRYWDFRDEIMDVERVRTIGGKNGENKEEDKKKAKAKKKKASPLDKIRKELDKLEKLHEKENEIVERISEIIDEASWDSESY